MIVRRYVVKDMPEAVMSIRKDLGKDAVILSTKKIRVKKWLGLRWLTRLEVTAAVGGDIPLHHMEPPRSVPNSGNLTGNSKPQIAETESAASISPHLEASSDANFSTTLASAFDAYQSASKSIQPPSADLHEMMKELASLKSLLIDQQNRFVHTTPEIRQVCAAFLAKQGLEEQHIKPWLDEALAGLDSNVSAREVIGRVMEIICKRAGAGATAVPIDANSRVVAFVGPTGVGKTTSIAKIAALHVLAGQRKVGLLTTDTFRIAAVAQLQTYADILDIPFVVAEDEATIGQALDQLSACDLVLVDTAGRNFRFGHTVTYTKRLLTNLSPDETILVISLSQKADDADALAETCESIGIDKYLFTKLDETDTVGVVPRLLEKYGHPMCYVTTGQNVPDDIDILSLDDILTVWSEGVEA